MIKISRGKILEKCFKKTLVYKNKTFLEVKSFIGKMFQKNAKICKKKKTFLEVKFWKNVSKNAKVYKNISRGKTLQIILHVIILHKILI